MLGRRAAGLKKQQPAGTAREGFYGAGRRKILPRVKVLGRRAAGLKKQQPAGAAREGFYGAGRRKILPRVKVLRRRAAGLKIGESGWIKLKTKIFFPLSTRS